MKTQFKVTNLHTKISLFLNENEKEDYFRHNAFQVNGKVKYDIINLTELKKIKYNKMLDVFAAICF